MILAALLAASVLGCTTYSHCEKTYFAGNNRCLAKDAYKTFLTCKQHIDLYAALTQPIRVLPSKIRGLSI